METTGFLMLAAGAVFNPFLIAFMVVFALLSIVVGLIELGAWLSDRREAARARAIREASIIAGARADYVDRAQVHAEVEQ